MKVDTEIALYMAVMASNTGSIILIINWIAKPYTNLGQIVIAIFDTGNNFRLRKSGNNKVIKN